MKIALTSCTKLKAEKPCNAKEMYLKSNLFRKATTYIENKDYYDWYILSAKYGLLDKHNLIVPYDITLNSMKTSERMDWAKKVLSQIEALTLDLEEVDFYAGKKYREYLIPMLEDAGIKCKVPLKGKGIGQQLSFYTNNKNN
ncbi:DUF6884 domain-containing protein [Robertmurraya kyonggiensis]|uniref:DUF6884 domain-containing protein n=1 Tax=Robertmurraya kyonggiensis TaxID=1037680 RepID=A0A4U1D996_9BACI|nr:DUF6884 domain-containing protein [Robertmurraya kyonggiensis]TKC19125.1 hypothetical protein FA727_06155 [Robertmurraya kyonggiensis]